MAGSQKVASATAAMVMVRMVPGSSDGSPVSAGRPVSDSAPIV
jgi:hypothetical protein